MKLKAAYDDFDQASFDTGVVCLEPTLAKQSFAEEVDINTIVRRFGLTGQLPQNVRMPSYVDFEGVFDFQSAMNAVAAARESFDEMPAAVRTRFGNDPGAFVDFCSDSKNREEALKMGLVDDKRAVVPSEPVSGRRRKDPAVKAPEAPVVPPKEAK